LSNQQKRSYSADELVSEGRLLSLTMCFRNIIKFPPEEMTRVLNGDRFLMVLLGLHGKAKYMGEQIEPAVYRQHPKGIWSGLQEQEQLFQNLNSMIHIYTYLTRIGKKDLAVSFLAKQVAPRIKDMYPPPPPGRRSNYKLNRTNIKRLVQYIKKKAIKSLSCLKYK